MGAPRPAGPNPATACSTHIRFNSLEINSSFYGLPRPETYRQWYRETPRGFRFAMKRSRFITHNKKLQTVETPLANYFASGVLLLRDAPRDALGLATRLA